MTVNYEILVASILACAGLMLIGGMLAVMKDRTTTWKNYIGTVMVGAVWTVAIILGTFMFTGGVAMIYCSMSNLCPTQ